MFGKDNIENNILPFFFNAGLEPDTAFEYSNFESRSGYSVFVISSLFGSKISDLDSYINAGIAEVQNIFEKIDLPILDRMKASIFKGGDFLANKMLSAGEEVEDVDFSVAVIAFMNDVMYVWIDGNLNLRIYRNTDSLLINPDRKPQFNGSTKVELGDILALAHNQYLEKEDQSFEDYVLEKQQPGYPALYIDYQFENNNQENTIVTPMALDTMQNADDINNPDESTNVNTISPLNPDSQDNVEYQNEELAESPIELRRDVANSQPNSNFSSKLNKDLLDKVISRIKSAGNYIAAGLMFVSSKIIDFFYKYVLRRNDHQLDRLRSNPKKKNLQYLIIAVIIVLTLYFTVFNGKSSNTLSTNTTNTQTTTAKTPDQLKAEVQAKFDTLTGFYNAAQVQSFNTAYTDLNTSIESAKSGGLTDTAFLDQITTNAQKYQDTLNKVTPVTKVDEVYFADSIPNAKLVDFAVVGTDVYAIDRTNAQILKSAAGQAFQVFAGDTRLAAMSQLVCETDKCYILDEGRGIAILNLASKSFNILTNLPDAGKNVKEMVSYSISGSYRLYTLVPSEGKVVRYDKVGEGFSSPGTWNQEAGFDADTQDFSVDGNIFELSTGGILRKFFNRKVDPAFTGLGAANPALGTKLQMVSTPARNPGPSIRNRVYIADSDNKAILVFDKDIDANGQFVFKGSYKYRGSERVSFSNFEEMLLSKDEKSIYILENNTVYRLSVTEI
jgi:hypothetical protein